MNLTSQEQALLKENARLRMENAKLRSLIPQVNDMLRNDKRFKKIKQKKEWAEEVKQRQIEKSAKELKNLSFYRP